MQRRQLEKGKENDRRLSNGDGAPPAVPKKRARKRKQPPVDGLRVPSPKRKARATRKPSAPSPGDVCDMDEDSQDAGDLAYNEALLRTIAAADENIKERVPTVDVDIDFVVNSVVHAAALDDAALDSFKPSPSPFKPSHLTRPSFRTATFETNLESVPAFVASDVGELMTAKHGAVGDLYDDMDEASCLHRVAMLEGLEFRMHGFHDGHSRDFVAQNEQEMAEARLFEAFEEAPENKNTRAAHGGYALPPEMVGGAVVDHTVLMNALANETFGPNPNYFQLETGLYVVQ